MKIESQIILNPLTQLKFVIIGAGKTVFNLFLFLSILNELNSSQSDTHEFKF